MITLYYAAQFFPYQECNMQTSKDVHVVHGIADRVLTGAPGEMYEAHVSDVTSASGCTETNITSGK